MTVAVETSHKIDLPGSLFEGEARGCNAATTSRRYRLVNGFVATYYPDNSRATALGWSLGIGRIGAILGPLLGGLIAGSGLGYAWNFYMFAAVAAVGLVLIAAVRRGSAPRTAASDRGTAAESDPASVTGNA